MDLEIESTKLRDQLNVKVESEGGILEDFQIFWHNQLGEC